MDNQTLWNRFKTNYFFDRQRGFAIDISRMKFSDSFLSSMEDKMKKAYAAMDELEKGSIVNPDEKRMVGHYWLRNAALAPNAEIRSAVEGTLSKMKSFAKDVHSGKIVGSKGQPFKHLLVVGIGGSALGPQFVNQALSTSKDPMDIYFFDNTDPDGMENVLSSIPDLSRTLCLIISKSGGTKETRNGQLVAKHALKGAGLEFNKHFVAVTGEGSELDKTADSEKWIARFPMWDWVGGRTSELSAVGMLPAALQGFDIDAVLRGARDMDELTRVKDTKINPAALLSLMWHHAGGGKGAKDMVVLPYKDRLELFSRYLQQLLMESLGKDADLDGKPVAQGIAVYGNKGSTDQHAYVQQLRDGLNNFFGVFIEVLNDRTKKAAGYTLPNGVSAVGLDVEEGITCGDYLSGFYQGTRRALFEKDRETVTITVNEVDEYSVGMLIALFERAVGFYATLVNINAYHQPGVEAGKKAAGEVLAVQKKVVDYLKSNKGTFDVEKIADAVGEKQNIETVFKVLRHLGANSRVEVAPGKSIFEDKYSLS